MGVLVNHLELVVDEPDVLLGIVRAHLDFVSLRPAQGTGTFATTSSGPNPSCAPSSGGGAVQVGAAADVSVVAAGELQPRRTADAPKTTAERSVSATFPARILTLLSRLLLHP